MLQFVVSPQVSGLSLPASSEPLSGGQELHCPPKSLLSLSFDLPCCPFSLFPTFPPPILHSLTSFFWVLISQPHPLLRLSQLSTVAGGCPCALFVLITFSDRLDSGCREIVGLGMGFSPSFFQFPFLLFGKETGGGERVALRSKQLLDLFRKGLAGNSCSSPRETLGQLGPPLFSWQSLQRAFGGERRAPRGSATREKRLRPRSYPGSPHACRQERFLELHRAWYLSQAVRPQPRLFPE